MRSIAHHSTWALPIASVGAAILWLAHPPGSLAAMACGGLLIGAVLAAVHHAEAIAHRVGEPFGTLVLALAVTAIEVSLMIAMMVGGTPGVEDLPRDTVFATVMIIVTGVVGLCLVLGGIRHHEQAFRTSGTGSALAALVVMAVLTIVLPSYTVSAPGPIYTTGQLTFAAIAALVLWMVHVYGQTVRHRDDFQDAPGGVPVRHHAHGPAFSLAGSAVFLVIALAGVVGLAKVLSPIISNGVAAVGAPQAVVGIAIALLVLLPETVAAARAAIGNRLQTALNLALGSALATIGLTIPAIALVANLLGLPLNLGLDARSVVLLMTAFLVCAITLGQGRSTVMLGAVHLVIFAAFLVMAVIP